MSRRADENTESRRKRSFFRELLEAGRLLPNNGGLKAPRRPVFKIFVGGHGPDFACERHAIRAIFPDLCRMCQERSISFDAIDLQYDYPLSVSSFYPAITVLEMQSCAAEATVGIRHIALVGNSVGMRPLPLTIGRAEYSSVLEKLDLEEDKQLFCHWYTKEEGCIPLRYKLLPALSASPVIEAGADLDDLSKEEKVIAGELYKKVEDRLKQMFGLGPSASLLSQELAIFFESKTPDQSPKSLVVIRQLNSIDYNDQNAALYTDRLPNGESNMTCAAYMESLHEKMQHLAGLSNPVAQYVVNWHPLGITDVNSAEHKAYIGTMAAAIRAHCVASIEESESGQGPFSDEETMVILEVNDHMNHAHALASKAFPLPEVDQLFTMLTKPSSKESNKPILLLAPQGAGKSTVMATVSTRMVGMGAKGSHELIRSAAKSSGEGQRFVISRFMHATSWCSSLTGLLSSICSHLAHIKNLYRPDGEAASKGEPTHLTGDESFEELTILLPSLISYVATKASLVILVDGVDEHVCRYHSEKNVEWVPTTLPHNVRMVVSLNGHANISVQEFKESCAEALKERIQGAMLGIAPLSASLQRDMLEFLINLPSHYDKGEVKTHHKMNKELQEEVLAVSEASNPFFLSLFLRLWVWDNKFVRGDSGMPLSVQSLVAHAYECLVALHGDLLVNHVLGLLIAAERVSTGLTELELLDLLSTMDHVLEEMNLPAKHKGTSRPFKKRMNRMLWAALKYDMIALGIVVKSSDEVGVLFGLAHPEFGIVARQRQVSDEVYLKSLVLLKNLLTGELLETYSSRMVNRDAHRNDLGARRMVRKLRLLPKLWAALALQTDGLFADPMVSYICDPTFTKLKSSSRIRCELYDDYVEAIDTISRCTLVKPAVKRTYISRIASASSCLPDLHSSAREVIHFDDLEDNLDPISVGHRLREWQCARFASLAHKYKHQLLQQSKDPKNAVLPQQFDIPSIKALQKKRQRMLLSQDFLPQSDEVSFLHQSIRHQCKEALAGAVYTESSLRELLPGFLKDRLTTLVNASTLLHLQRGDDESLNGLLDRASTCVNSEFETIAALHTEALNASDAVSDLAESAEVHLRWLVHRHHTSWNVHQFLINLQWALYGKRKGLFEYIKASAAAQDADNSQDTIEFPSHLGKGFGLSHLCAQSVSIEDAELDRSELLPLKKELGITLADVDDINCDDGYLFQHACHAALLQSLDRTSISFPAFSENRNAAFTGQTFQKKNIAMFYTPDLLQPEFEQFQVVSRERVDALVLVDSALQEFAQLAAVNSISTVTSMLKQRAEHHNQSISAAFAASTSWQNRGQKKAIQRDFRVQLSYNKVAALYNLYLTSFRFVRRRILGICNYMFVVKEWVCGMHAVVCKSGPQASPARGLDEEGLIGLLGLRHSFTVDDDGVVHCRDDEQVQVVYEEAMTALARVEDRLLRIATYTIKEAETRTIPNKPSVLHDLYQCEVAFQEAKLRHVALLLDILQHACEATVMAEHLQRVCNAIYLEPCIDLSARFVAADYEQHITALNKASDFLRQVMISQIECERSYLTSVATYGRSLDGLGIPTYKLVTVQQPATFKLLPTEWSIEHRAAEILPSVAYATSVLTLCQENVEALYTDFQVGSIQVALAFQNALLDLAFSEWSRHQDAPSMEPPQFVSKCLTVMEDPVALMGAVEAALLSHTTRVAAAEAIVREPTASNVKKSGGPGRLALLINALELVHVRWLLRGVLWELAALGQETGAFCDSFHLKVPIPPDPSSNDGARKKKDGDHRSKEAAITFEWRLGDDTVRSYVLRVPHLY